MKRISILLSVAILLIANWAHGLSIAENAIISKTEGSPQIVQSGQSRPARVGISCGQGDVLKTNAQCSVDVSLNNQAGCRLLSDSECVLISSNEQTIALKLNAGNAVLNLKKLPKDSTFRVETPTAVASVRGTQFWGRVDSKTPDNPVTTFAVREGTVEILTKASGGTFVLQQGQALDIPQNPAVPSLIRPALDEEMSAMEQASSIRTDMN